MEIQTVKISDEAAYLMQTHLVTYTKKLVERPQDREDEITDVSKLAQMVRDIPVGFSKPIVEEVQAQVCRSALAHVQAEAARIKAISGKELQVLQEMLTRTMETAEKYSMKRYDKKLKKEIVETVDVPSSKRKLIGCSLYKIKAVMIRLRETQALVGVKKMVSKSREKETYVIFYRATTAGGVLQRVADTEVKKIKRDEPVIILRGFVGLDREALAKQINNIGLYELMLINGAIVPPYDPGATGKSNTTADIPLADARAEYGELIKRVKGGVANDLPFILDHVYCSTKGNEV